MCLFFVKKWLGIVLAAVLLAGIAQSQAVLAASHEYILALSPDGVVWIREDCTALPPNQLYTGRTMGLFEYRGAEFPVGVIYSQIVTVLEEYANWRKVGTWMGPKWIYMDFEPPTAELDDLLRRFPNTSVFFKNVETGFTYRWNADREFFGASISKASYALHLYQMAEKGEVDLDSQITFMQQDWNGGSGVIRHMHSVGDSFTTRRLLELNLYESDNIATNMLRRIHGIEEYRQFVTQLGGNPGMIRDRIFNSQLTANEVGLFAQAIWDYVESGGKYSEEFKDALLNNQFPFIAAGHPIASKTGWTSGIAWHDMSIVYAPSPYILVVLSAREGWREADYRDFAEIAGVFEAFNDRWF